jgi:hypothetical protein
LSELQWVDYCQRNTDALKNLQRTLRRFPKAPPLPDPLPDAPPAPIPLISQLRGKIDSDSLARQDQIQLVFDLRQQFRQGVPAKEIMDLLQRLRNRDDLFATVSQEIDDLIRDIGTSQPRVAAADEPELPAPAKAMSRLNRRQMQKSSCPGRRRFFSPSRCPNGNRRRGRLRPEPRAGK